MAGEIPKSQIKDVFIAQCKTQKCQAKVNELRNCVARIKLDKTQTKHCTGYYLDMWSCIDHCAYPKIVKQME